MTYNNVVEDVEINNSSAQRVSTSGLGPKCSNLPHIYPPYLNPHIIQVSFF